MFKLIVTKGVKIFIASFCVLSFCIVFWNSYFTYYEHIEAKHLFDICKKKFVPNDLNSKLNCYLKKLKYRENVAYLFEKPAKIEQLNVDPVMEIYYDAFTLEENRNQKMILYKKNFTATLHYGQYGFAFHGKQRTGANVILDATSQETYNLWSQINKVTGFNVNPNNHFFRALLYRKGQYFSLHNDGLAFQKLEGKFFATIIEHVLRPFTRIYNKCKLGHAYRADLKETVVCLLKSLNPYYHDVKHKISGTVLFPVTSWKSGGEMIFPEMNLKLKLPPKSLLYFSILKNNGEVEDRLIHGACPLLSDDTKIVVQSHIRLR